MKRIIFALIFVLFTGYVSAHDADITYPISELGNCASKDECREYCSLEENWESCGEFAKSHREGQLNDNGISFPISELGNCENEKSCREYCDNPANINTCISFAKKHGLMSAEDAERAEKMSNQFGGGDFRGPGGCSSPTECRAYCDNEENFETCIDFAEENGFISKEEADAIRKFGPGFTGPGGCKSKEECESYCEDNVDACIEFAKENGMISEKEAEIAKKMMSGGGPGGCKGQRECQEFCSNPSNQETCMIWARENGMISDEQWEAQRPASTRSGPGGCKSEAECMEYCSDPANSEECSAFGPGGEDTYASEFRPEGVSGRGSMPSVCQERGLEPRDCMAFCRNNPDACAETPRGQAPPGVEQIGQQQSEEELRRRMEETGRNYQSGNTSGGEPVDQDSDESSESNENSDTGSSEDRGTTGQFIKVVKKLFRLD